MKFEKGNKIFLVSSKESVKKILINFYSLESFILKELKIPIEKKRKYLDLLK